jgi:hypothetical protein
MKNISGKICRENRNTHFGFKNLKKNHVYETRGKYFGAGQAYK